MFPIKQVRNLDLLDGTTESLQEIPQKSRRTLMSLQEYEITWGSSNHSRLNPIPLHWLQNNSLFPIVHEKWLNSFRQLPKFLRHTSSVYRNTNFSTGTRVKLHAPHIVSRSELIPRILLNRRPTLNKHLKRSLPSPIGM